MPFKSKAHQAAVMLALKKRLLLTSHDLRGLHAIKHAPRIRKQGYHGMYFPMSRKILLARPLTSRSQSAVMTARHEIGHHVLSTLPDRAQSRVLTATLKIAGIEGKRANEQEATRLGHELFADAYSSQRNRHRLVSKKFHPPAFTFRRSLNADERKQRDILAYVLRARRKRK